MMFLCLKHKHYPTVSKISLCKIQLDLWRVYSVLWDGIKVSSWPNKLKKHIEFLANRLLESLWNNNKAQWCRMKVSARVSEAIQVNHHFVPLFDYPVFHSSFVPVCSIQAIAFLAHHLSKVLSDWKRYRKRTGWCMSFYFKSPEVSSRRPFCGNYLLFQPPFFHPNLAFPLHFAISLCFSPTILLFSD